MQKQRVGWVIVDPKGKVLIWTCCELEGLTRDHLNPGAWDCLLGCGGQMMLDVEHQKVFREIFDVFALKAKAEELGYRAEPVYMEVK